MDGRGGGYQCRMPGPPMRYRAVRPAGVGNPASYLAGIPGVSTPSRQDSIAVDAERAASGGASPSLFYFPLSIFREMLGPRIFFPTHYIRTSLIQRTRVKGAIPKATGVLRPTLIPLSDIGSLGPPSNDNLFIRIGCGLAPVELQGFRVSPVPVRSAAPERAATALDAGSDLAPR